MKALIDADMPAMELGMLKIWTETPAKIETREGKEYAWNEKGEEIFKDYPSFEFIEPIAKGRFVSIFIKSEAGAFEAYLSKGETFRHRLATILTYKGNRNQSERPPNVARIKQSYVDSFGATFCHGYEADDGMAMEQWGDWMALAKLSNYDEDYIRENASTVICSRDKDLDTVPGWHFKWTLKREAEKREALGEVHVEKLPYYVTLIDSIRNFYKQLLMGDSTDNIKGLYNVGAKSAWIKQLDGMYSEAEMYEHVQEKYHKYYGNWWYKALVETARLLHLWRKKEDVWLPPPERDNTWHDDI